MKKLFFIFLINTIAIFVAALIISTIKVDNYYYLVLAGVIMTLVNIIIRPLLIIVALPFNIITLGLFTLVINAWMVMLVDRFIGGLHIPGFWPSLGVAVIIMLFNQLFRKVIPVNV